ncbi:MAG: Fatty acid-binding protein [Acidimicrobiales bacterium]|nr:Fatty acid-binding protein [Acidimicrobiales bacterium]
MAIAIVTDAAASLPAELVDRYGITVVPMWLNVRGVPVRSGERPLEELVTEEDISTSGPSPGEFTSAIEANSPAEGVVVLTIASTMSSTHQAALLAAKNSEQLVRVVDTGTAAGAEGLVVLAAAQQAARGGDLDSVEAAANEAIARVRLVATVPSLDHLVRSGRVPNIAGWAGRRLNINPLFEFRDGEAKRLRPSMSREAALERIVHIWRRSRVEGADLHVAALHALAPDVAADLMAEVTSEIEPATAFVGEFGSVMVVHTGPGLAGLAWWWEGPNG